MSDMKSRDTFSLYVYKLHELINDMLNKKSGLTYEDVKIRYENFRARCAPLHTENAPKGAGFECRRGHRMRVSNAQWCRLPNKTIKKKKGENGCTEPLIGEKSKCILKIVPVTTKCETFQIEDSCLKKPVSN